MIHPNYSCYTVVGEFQGAIIWEHRVVSKDQMRAMSISYSPDVKRITPPIYHQHNPDPPSGDGVDDCDVVKPPCVANIGLLDIFELGAMNQDHSGEMDPGATFWTMMIRRLESYPKERNYDDSEDPTQDHNQNVQDLAACNCGDQAHVTQQGRPTNDVGPGQQDIQREVGPSGRDIADRASGTTRVCH